MCVCVCERERERERKREIEREKEVPDLHHDLGGLVRRKLGNRRWVD